MAQEKQFKELHFSLETNLGEGLDDARLAALESRRWSGSPLTGLEALHAPSGRLSLSSLSPPNSLFLFETIDGRRGREKGRRRRDRGL